MSKNPATKISLFFVLVLLSGASASAEAIRAGAWEYEFDQKNGYVSAVKWNGVTVSENPAGLPPFNWGPGWPGGKPAAIPQLFKSVLPGGEWFPQWDVFQKEAAFHLTSFRFDEKTPVLRKQYRIGEWSAEEKLEFGAKGDPDLLAVTLKLTYAPAGKDKKPALLANVIFNWPIAGNRGRILFPATPRGDFAGRGPRGIAELPAIYIEEGWGNQVVPVLLEQTGYSAVLAASPFKDKANMLFAKNGGNALLSADFAAYGWAWPDEPQEIGPFYFKATKARLEDAFRTKCHELYDTLGWKVPADRPEWTKYAMLYTMSPGGSPNANQHNLGGFNGVGRELLPRVAALGLNTVWSLPVQDGPFGYWPRFYRQINPRYGTAEEFRKLIDTGHALGLRMLLDIVPHGGTPSFGRDRGNKPWELTFDRDGNALPYWCFDFGVPSWREYMTGVAEFQMKIFGLDGFRIDVPDATHVPNWSRPDFPGADRVPGNVPAEWWTKSLSENGGSLPKLPYERASFGRSGAGVEMIDAIRSGMKAVKPRESALLAEVQYPIPYTVNADMIYDMQLCYDFSGRLLPGLDPAEFVRRLSTLLEEQKFAEPEGVIRMRYIESQDSDSATDRLGVGAAQAMRAVTFLIDGMPMVFQDSDVGQGILIRNLATLRRILPELNEGKADYLAVRPEPGSVFACLRTLDDKVSLGLVNLSPRTSEARFSIPPGLLPDGDLNVWDCRRGNKIASGKADRLGELTVPLAPWENTVLAVRRKAAPLPLRLEPQRPSAAAPPANGTVSAQKNPWGDVLVDATGYHLCILANGDLGYFRNAEGETLLDGTRFLYDDTLNQAWPHLPPESRPVPEKTSFGWRIGSTTRLPTGGDAHLAWNCYPDHVELNATLNGKDSARSAGLVLSSSTAKRWQVNTMEGMLDDLFTVRNRFGFPDKSRERTSRIHGTPIQYQAKLAPLSPENPVITALTATGDGIALTLENPLQAGVDDVMVLDKLAQDERWHAAFLWKNPEQHFPLPEHCRDFTLRLTPVTGALPRSAQSTATRIGKVGIENRSFAWQISNDFYSVEILRTGGVIQSLTGSTGRTLLRKSDLIVGGGFVPTNETLALSADMDTGVSLRSENGKAILLFTGTVCRAALTRNPDPPVYGAIRYTFDESPRIGIDCFFLDGSRPSFPDLTVYALLGAGPGLRAAADGKEGAAFRDASGKTVFRVDGIRGDLCRILPESDSLKLFLFDGNAAGFEPWKQYRLSAVIDTGD